MRFPSLAFAAVAGLWQQPLAPTEESITSTRHIHITRTVTNSASTIYAVRMGTSTAYMEYLPATLMTRSIPWQALQTGHLELRSDKDTTSTIHVKVTQTVAQVRSTVFASKAGTSVSTITDVPQSLLEEAAKDAADLSSSQEAAAAVSSDNPDVLAHSTVAMLQVTTSSTLSTASALPFPIEAEGSFLSRVNSSSSTSLDLATSTSTSSTTPIGLELRSNEGLTASTQQQGSTTEAPATVLAVIYGTSTSIMTSVPSTLLAQVVSSEALAASLSSVSRAISMSASTTETSNAFLSIDTNAAQIKSTQSALIPSSAEGNAAAASETIPSSTTTTPDCFGNCASHSSLVLSPSSTGVSSTLSTTSSSSVSGTSDRVYTIPFTTRASSSIKESNNVHASTATGASVSAPFPTAYGSESSASASADIAADNAAGASGGDSGSFKLSKGGFAAIISVVSVGVGLGIIFLVLFVVARRRQWNIRQSIARASRRVTGRFSSHPNKTALHSEKEPTLPVIEPRQPLGPRPAPAGKRQRGFANMDAALYTNYRGVETVSRSASRGPEAWRREMAMERMQQQKRKPQLRVDTGLATIGMEEGRVRGQEKKRGDWKDFFRAL